MKTLQRVVLVYELRRPPKRFNKQVEEVEWAIDNHKLNAEVWMAGSIFEGRKSQRAD